MKIPSIFRNPTIAPFHTQDIWKSGNFSVLPTEIIIEIFSKLSVREFLIVPRVNRHFYTVCQNKTLIKRIFYAHVPMAENMPSFYESVDPKAFLTGKGWPLLFAPPRVVIPRYEKVLILCHQISKAWRTDETRKAGIITLFFSGSAHIFNKVYEPLVIQKANRAIKEFQKSILNDLKTIEQLKNSLVIQNPSLKRRMAESVLYVHLKHKMKTTDAQLKANPRWTIAKTTLDIRKKPCLTNWRIPQTPKGGTLLTARLLTDSERVLHLQELNSTLQKQVNSNQEILATKLTSLEAEGPWYKKVLNVFLLSIGMLGFSIGLALVVHKIYQLIKLFVMLYYFAKRALNF